MENPHIVLRREHALTAIQIPTNYTFPLTMVVPGHGGMPFNRKYPPWQRNASCPVKTNQHTLYMQLSSQHDQRPAQFKTVWRKR